MSPSEAAAKRSSGNFADNPRRHTALVLDDGGLQRVEQLAAQFSGEAREQHLINQVALGPVREPVSAARDGLHLLLHPDG